MESRNVCGTISKSVEREEERLKFYTVVAVPTLLIENETWVKKNQDLSDIQAAGQRK
jgi:hypothetical protein